MQTLVCPTLTTLKAPHLKSRFIINWLIIFDIFMARWFSGTKSTEELSETGVRYLALGYGYKMAVLIALLTECLLISLSLLSAWTVDLIWKGALLTCCVLTCFVVVNILDSSARHRSDAAAQKSEQVERLKKEIATLEALEGTALALIKKYDPRVYPTKIKALMAQLETPDSRG